MTGSLPERARYAKCEIEMKIHLDKSALEYVFNAIGQIGALKALGFACLALLATLAIIEVGTPVLKSTGDVLAPAWEQTLRKLID
tara:strand:+ start:2235 stop:2489 length:255 start_codon:yes stop_codon:yes gene_type:complete